MAIERGREEILKDKAFILVILAKVSQAINNNVIGDRLKIQKLAFLICYALFQERMKGLNYTFFTYRWGPFTKDLYEAEADFEEADLLERQGPSYTLTEQGKRAGLDLYNAMSSDKDNYPILEILDELVNKYARWSTEDLLLHTHKMQVRPIGWRNEEPLETLPYHLELTKTLDDEEATAILEINQAWLDSFALLLSKPSIKTSYA